MALVTTQWLSKNKHNVKIIDSSWHLPNTRRNGYLEYSKEHITNAIYFDIDKYSDQNSKLPHMLPDKERWEEIMSSIGISNKDKVVVYDNSEVLSSCRLWYTFLYFGHNTGATVQPDLYLAEFIGVDGQQLAPTSFGEFKNGVWIPIDYSGTYGNNGFRLKFENSSDLGNDSSGNNNDFSTNGLGADHQVLDSPTFGS